MNEDFTKYPDYIYDTAYDLSIDILYTLDCASNYSAIQKLKPLLQSQVIPMK
jgi:hypothetical protein